MKPYKNAPDHDLLNSTSSIPTPFLVVQEEVLDANINRIHDYARSHGFAVRPHVKTHKSLHIAGTQLQAGAAGIAVAKVGEAEVMSRLGDVDITVAYPAVGEDRAKRIARLARTHRIRVAVDSTYLMDALSDAALESGSEIGIHVMFDAGLHRCGYADPETVTRLAAYAERMKGLRYDGIQLYLGHLYGEAAHESRSFDAINKQWKPVYEALCHADLCPHMVSSGSTPSLFNTHMVEHVNELRVGTAVLNDYFVMYFGHCSLEQCAARVVATVVSDATPGQVIIDAGSKSLSAKQMLRNERLTLGYIVEYPEARLFRLHEEHGWIDTSRCMKAPHMGQRLSIIPVNIALCMNLYDTFYILRSNGTTECMKVDARGCHV